jgi:hypothetical protein
MSTPWDARAAGMLPPVSPNPPVVAKGLASDITNTTFKKLTPFQILWYNDL